MEFANTLKKGGLFVIASIVLESFSTHSLHLRERMVGFHVYDCAYLYFLLNRKRAYLYLDFLPLSCPLSAILFVWLVHAIFAIKYLLPIYLYVFERNLSIHLSLSHTLKLDAWTTTILRCKVKAIPACTVAPTLRDGIHVRCDIISDRMLNWSRASRMDFPYPPLPLSFLLIFRRAFAVFWAQFHCTPSASNDVDRTGHHAAQYSTSWLVLAYEWHDPSWVCQHHQGIALSKKQSGHRDSSLPVFLFSFIILCVTPSLPPPPPPHNVKDVQQTDMHIILARNFESLAIDQIATFVKTSGLILLTPLRLFHPLSLAYVNNTLFSICLCAHLC